jgi:hypothetical protein
LPFSLSLLFWLSSPKGSAVAFAVVVACFVPKASQDAEKFGGLFLGGSAGLQPCEKTRQIQGL